ncbi:unnamed protein product, partial [Rotaria sp. Silwood1]
LSYVDGFDITRHWGNKSSYHSANDFDMTRHWGHLSPYHPADSFGIQDIGIPSNCEVSQVHILHRHGQRFPTTAFNDGGNTQRFAYKESARWWASGFFDNSDGGSSSTSYDLLVIPEDGTENNTLVAHDSCRNSDDDIIRCFEDTTQGVFTNNYLKTVLARLSNYLDPKFNLTIMDVYAMQTICPYEVAYQGSSDFCRLFTEQEWIDFDYALSLRFYGNRSFGNPTGRVHDIGYVQELLARLQNQYIYVGNISVNSTLDNNPTTFPLGQPFYLDMTHDNIMVGVLSALGLNYFKGSPTGLPYNITHAPNPPENF